MGTAVAVYSYQHPVSVCSSLHKACLKSSLETSYAYVCNTPVNNDTPIFQCQQCCNSVQVTCGVCLTLYDGSKSRFGL